MSRQVTLTTPALTDLRILRNMRLHVKLMAFGCHTSTCKLRAPFDVPAPRPIAGPVTVCAVYRKSCEHKVLLQGLVYP